MLKVEQLAKRLGDFEMRDVSFEVPAGGYFVLLGASGTGKTVLIETLGGFLRPDAGRIVLGGREITGERAQRRAIGIVFQDQALFPHLDVGGNIAYGPASRGAGRQARRETVARLAAETGVDHLLRRRPATLSGGEAQRVALARALATAPDCLLLDEPLSALDAGARAELRSLLRRINAGGTTIVHVTHDYEEAVSLADTVGVMEGGTIVQVDAPAEILMHPRSEFVARFVGIRNMYRGRLAAGANGGTSRFSAPGIDLTVSGAGKPGPCVALVRSEDVTLALERTATSARNVLAGTVVEIVPAPGGIEVVVDTGTALAALVTAESARRLALRPGLPVFAAIKAGAVRVIAD